ncbi:hypothetical protein BC567DRAFT_207266 [Phyllosticta citribraziliensis]
MTTITATSVPPPRREGSSYKRTCWQSRALHFAVFSCKHFWPMIAISLSVSHLSSPGLLISRLSVQIAPSGDSWVEKPDRSIGRRSMLPDILQHYCLYVKDERERSTAGPDSDPVPSVDGWSCWETAALRTIWLAGWLGWAGPLLGRASGQSETNQPFAPQRNVQLVHICSFHPQSLLLPDEELRTITIAIERGRRIAHTGTAAVWHLNQEGPHEGTIDTGPVSTDKLIVDHHSISQLGLDGDAVERSLEQITLLHWVWGRRLEGTLRSRACRRVSHSHLLAASSSSFAIRGNVVERVPPCLSALALQGERSPGS